MKNSIMLLIAKIKRKKISPIFYEQNRHQSKHPKKKKNSTKQKEQRKKKFSVIFAKLLSRMNTFSFIFYIYLYIIYKGKP